MALGSASAAFQDVVLAFFFWRQDATGGNTLECSPADRAVRACRTETAAFASEAVVSADATRRPPWTTVGRAEPATADARSARAKQASAEDRSALSEVVRGECERPYHPGSLRAGSDSERGLEPERRRLDGRDGVIPCQ